MLLKDGRTIRITNIIELNMECDCRESERRWWFNGRAHGGQEKIIMFGDLLHFQSLPVIPYALCDNYDLSSLLRCMPRIQPGQLLENSPFDPSEIDVKCIAMSIGEFTYRVLVDVRMELD